MNNKRDILNAWKNVTQKEPYSIYLHSPFCAKKCRYCVYTGCLTSQKDYKKLYRDYIDLYMPKAIDAYKDVFLNAVAENLYFGGGTPNLMSSQDISDICNRIPNFDKIPNKIIDLHPMYLSDEKIETIINLGFSTVCIGIQSFDEETLARNNRDNLSFERIQKIIAQFRTAGVYTSIDLMCYITNYNEKDLDLLEMDIKKSLWLDLDFIDINPNLHFIYNDRQWGKLFEYRVDAIANQLKDDYVSEKSINGSDQLNNRWIYRIVNKRVADKFYSDVLPYYADDFPYANNNIIGIGDLHNGHSTMSYIHNQLYYVEHNINNDPVYEIKFARQKHSNISSLKQMILKNKNG